MIKVIDSRRSILVDSLSVPKTMGKGPIITAPPPLAFPFPLVVVKNMRMTAIKAMRNPAKNKMTPKLNKNWLLIHTFTSFDI